MTPNIVNYMTGSSTLRHSDCKPLVRFPVVASEDVESVQHSGTNVSADASKCDMSPGTPQSDALCGHVDLDYDRLEGYIQHAIRRQLELEICSPMVCKNYRGLLHQQCVVNEKRLQEKIAMLDGKSQEYFGITAQLASPSNWYDVKKAFRAITSCAMTFDRIVAFIKAIKIITVVSHLEHRSIYSAGSGYSSRNRSRTTSNFSEPGQDGGASGASATITTGDDVECGKPTQSTDTDVRNRSTSIGSLGNCKNTIIGADDFLPILIYVIVHCKVVNILALNAEFQALCAYNLRASEYGYYLTAFDAALSYLLEFDVEFYGNKAEAEDSLYATTGNDSNNCVDGNEAQLTEKNDSCCSPNDVALGFSDMDGVTAVLSADI